MEESFGAYLRKQRECRQVSLHDISRQTLIRREFLEALEAERFEKLPGLTFIKGYLRSYADFIGLDANDVITRFESSLPRHMLSSHRPSRSKKKITQYGFVFLLLMIIGLLLWYLL